MADDIIRIVSDVHFGDRASLVDDFEQLAPLFTDASRVIFNGDTLDTREGPNPSHTARCREVVLAFAATTGIPTTFHTGNHDPDFSNDHWSELAGGSVFVIHGDVLFDDIVPWGRDARTIRRRLAAALTERGYRDPIAVPLPIRMAIWRAVARSIPQRHQSERHPLKYAWHFLADTVWPPTRFFAIFRAWQREPRLAMDLLERERLPAKYVILGHTHRPAIQRAGSTVVLNTGSFTAPFGPRVIEINRDTLRVRRIRRHRGEFRLAETLAEFPLANRS